MALSRVTDTHGTAVLYDYDCAQTNEQCRLKAIKYGDAPSRCFVGSRGAQICEPTPIGARIGFY